jgi:hypothetical protein
MSKQTTGLFLASYTITSGAMGAPTFQLNLSVYTPKETVHGVGQITNTANPPLHITTKLDGSYTYMTVMPNNTHILVTALGYPIDSPVQGGVPTAIRANAELRMVLTEDWKSGTATYKYVDDQGNTHSINDAKVQSVDANTLK